MRDADNGNSCDSQSEKRDPIITRLGIEEEKFVRPAKKGNYTPTIHEIDDLVIDDKINQNEMRVLFFIKSKTINFRNTEVRLKRRDIQERLSMNKRMLREAITGLIEKQYLLEMPDKDSYYFYGLNPITFDGLICLRSVNEAPYRLNRNLKPIEYLNSKSKKTGSQKAPLWVLKVSEWGPFRTHDEQAKVRNYSGFEMLKYTLLKYIYLNGFSAGRGELILEIVNEIRNPEYLMKQFVALIQSSPLYGRAITDELIRSNSMKTDGFNRPLKTNPLAYIVTCWTELRPHFQNVPHPTFDKSEDLAALRKELADLIASYPIEMNQGPAKVFEFKKA